MAKTDLRTLTPRHEWRALDMVWVDWLDRFEAINQGTRWRATSLYVRPDAARMLKLIDKLQAWGVAYQLAWGHKAFSAHWHEELERCRAHYQNKLTRAA